MIQEDTGTLPDAFPISGDTDGIQEREGRGKTSGDDPDDERDDEYRAAISPLPVHFILDAFHRGHPALRLQQERGIVFHHGPGFPQQFFQFLLLPIHRRICSLW